MGWPRLISRSSQAFAVFQSRMTVSGDTFKTSAVSRRLRPPKNLSSTTWLIRASNVARAAECIAEGDEVAILRVRQLLHVIETHVNRTATAFLALPVAGELHQDPSHHLRRDREEVRAIPPFDSIDVDQPQVRLVHQ
jgi:hypothetical protein